MINYSDADIDEAVERIAADVVRRSSQSDFPAAAIDAALDEVRRMEVARRSGDAAAAVIFATTAQTGLAQYRPTNATSRSKAVLAEVLSALIDDSPRAPDA